MSQGHPAGKQQVLSWQTVGSGQSDGCVHEEGTHTPSTRVPHGEHPHRPLEDVEAVVEALVAWRAERSMEAAVSVRIVSGPMVLHGSGATFASPLARVRCSLWRTNGIA
jgi:hypothetical protein